DKPPLNNPLVRQAIYYAIDRKALADGLFAKYAIPAVSPAAMTTAGSVATFPVEDFNRDKAKQLLQQAGVAPGVKIDLDVLDAYQDVAQVIQAQLKEVGLNVNVNVAQNPITDAKRVQAKANPTMVFN